MDTASLSRHDVSRLITPLLRVIRETARVSELVALLVSHLLGSRVYKQAPRCTSQTGCPISLSFQGLTPDRRRVKGDVTSTEETVSIPFLAGRPALSNPPTATQLI
jgi:hypothetical protein